MINVFPSNNNQNLLLSLQPPTFESAVPVLLKYLHSYLARFVCSAHLLYELLCHIIAGNEKWY